MDSVEIRLNLLQEKFNQFDNWEDRYKELISMGKNLPILCNEGRIPANLIKGCQSQVWLYGQLDEHFRLRLEADSDASIVKGLVAVLIYLYDNCTVEEAMKATPQVIELLGLKNHLSLNRSNGLISMINQIRFYGMAFHAKMNLIKK